MKKLTKYLCCLALLSMFCTTLVGCSKEEPTDTNQTNKTTEVDDNSEDELALIDKQITNKFNNDYNITKDEVIDAINYINENIDDVSDKEVAKKLYEKASYLEAASNKGEVDDEDAIRNLAIKTKAFASDVYNAGDNEVEDIINDGKNTFNELKEKLGDDINSAADNFMNFFENQN